MFGVYKQTICKYFTLPEVELISSAKFCGDMGTLSKCTLNLSGVIITMVSVIIQWCATVMILKCVAQGKVGLNIYTEHPLTLFTFP